MKNLETMPAEEMRTMLMNIDKILNTTMPQDFMIEKIGMEFFEEGPDPKIATAEDYIN